MENNDDKKIYQDKANLETDKLRLENEKILLEIKSLKRNWWQDSKFFNIIATIVIGLITLYLTYINGFFDLEKKTLELRKENLKHEINNFEIKKKELSSNLDSITIELRKTKDSIHNLNFKFYETNKILNKLKNEKKTRDIQILQLKNNNQIEKIIKVYDSLLNEKDIQIRNLSINKGFNDNFSNIDSKKYLLLIKYNFDLENYEKLETNDFKIIADYDHDIFKIYDSYDSIIYTENTAKMIKLRKLNFSTNNNDYIMYFRYFPVSIMDDEPNFPQKIDVFKILK